MLEKQERKSVWVYALIRYVLTTEKRYNMHGLKWFWNNYIYIFWPSRGKTYLRSFRPGYCHFQPAQPQRLARILKFRLSANNKDVDQTAQKNMFKKVLSFGTKQPPQKFVTSIDGKLLLPKTTTVARKPRQKRKIKSTKRSPTKDKHMNSFSHLFACRIKGKEIF